MKYERISLGHKVGEAFTIPLGLVNIVFIATDKGMVGCGAFDVKALDKFGYPAARVKPSQRDIIETINDLLAGTIKDVNNAAKELGIVEGMAVKEALELL